MQDGFFSKTKVAKGPPPSKIPKCGACGLYKTCNSPKMPVVGKGKKRILVIGEAPGAEEDKQNAPFVGASGKRLKKELRSLGIDLLQDCWVTNALICRPPKNETPTSDQLLYCKPNLRIAIETYDPIAVVTLGAPATKSILEMVWKEDVGGVARWAGQRIPCPKPNLWICPTFHPSYVERSDDRAVDFFFKHDLERAFDIDKKPWDNPPKYEESVEVVLDHNKAAKILKQMTKRVAPIAFDYETNMLKPDSKNSAIYSCSVCWKGKRTIAFPWVGKVIGAMRELLRAPHPKIASNMKFEDRWTRAILKTPVRNWAWDTMLAGHVLDNRSFITSIKYQSFCRIGALAYDSHIKPLLRADGGSYTPNKVDQIDINDLLIYNGLDSLLEYLTAQHQVKEAGYTPPLLEDFV